MSYFPETGNYDRNKIKFGIDFPNYATKSDVKKATGVDTSEFPIKADLASLKPDVDKLNTDELEIVPTDLSKLNSTGDNHVVKTPYMMN